MNLPSKHKVVQSSSSCDCDAEGCGRGLQRRDVLKLTGLVAAETLLSSRQIAMAGPFTSADFEKLVPADKRLSESWVRSLFERGKPEWFEGDDLKLVGMPVGGICCGQVYLSGDGRLWHWDIFNEPIVTRGRHYQYPMKVDPKLDLRFGVEVKTAEGSISRSLDQMGFPRVRFRGAYPIGFVEYAADDFPITVSLESYSPFVPLDVDSSSLPLTVMRYTVRNPTKENVEVALAGSMSNPVLQKTGNVGDAEFVNTIWKRPGATCLHFTVDKRVARKPAAPRTDIVFDDFESERYENWTVEGTAFGSGPIAVADMPAYQGDVGAHGKRLVNSHNVRQGEDVGGGDAHVGILTSQPFRIQRHYIHVLIGGGASVEETAIQLLIGDKVVASLTGRNDNKMRLDAFQVQAYEGQTARLRIVDQRNGGWGNIGIDRIVFSDQPIASAEPMDTRSDMGDMTLALLGDVSDVFAAAEISGDQEGSTFQPGPEVARSATSIRPTGTVGRTIRLAPGEEATVAFSIAWRFANVKAPVDQGHYYAKRFGSSLDATDHLVDNFERLHQRTRLWHDTWYDSTLPYWFLDRTFTNTSSLATSTCMRMESGRFWGWEGVRCCPGTCSHVWHYAQAVGRVFPELERIVRERVDFGLAWQPDGQIFYRAEFGQREAVDGQCGTILRVYREHQMSSDADFLRRIWPRVKKSIEYLMKLDGDANGILEGEQYNTLDASWYGPISWLSSLYVAALHAGAAMAQEMNDEAFAEQCSTLAQRGSQWMTANLFNGEYYYQQRDPEHPEAFGAGIGCHIDQVFGQGWAHQVGLPRVLPPQETRTSLKSLWRYNFTPDVGPYRKKFSTGRWYAMPGEAGLIMCTFPKGGEREARGGKPTHGFAGYLNECMNGFEYQAAGHMIAEGHVQDGFAVTRAIHDRYHPSRRNPYNEVECGDHYARSMASYGVYLSACGFSYHGPQGRIGFSPKLGADKFRAAFIGAEGWGTFEQELKGEQQEAKVIVRHGSVRIKTVTLELSGDKPPTAVRVSHGDQSISASLKISARTASVQLEREAIVSESEELVLSFS
jgi:non-lysosomal glucosylceramidase